MKHDVKLKISKEINRVLTENPNYQSQLAKKMGLSGSHLINMKDETKWDLVSSKTWKKAASFFSKDGQWRLLETNNFNAIMDLCQESQQTHSFISIIGKSGLGKTATLKHYSRHTPNAFYVLLDCFKPNKATIYAICKAIGADVTGDRGQLIRNIGDKLNSLEDPLLILDDVGKVVDSNYRLIQLIYDMTEGNCGIVISGTLYLRDHIIAMTRKEKMGFDELNRRIQYWHRLSTPTIEEVASICDKHGITDAKAIHYIHNTAKDFGTIRNIILNAKRKDEQPGIKELEKVRVN